MVTMELLDELRRIARAAGELAMQHYGVAGGVTLKADDSPLTNADRAAHEAIVSALAELTPDIPVISEEGWLPPFEERRYWRRFWLVDPLDGTKEFIQQNGEFTVNIALVEDGEPVLGVVYAPAIHVEYAAGRGLGSWKSTDGGEPVRLTGPSVPGPEGAVVVESRSHPSKALEEFLGTIKVARRVQAGSSLKFGVVAEGAAHLYPRFGPTHEWDVAAGVCVWRTAAAAGQRPSSLVYNSPDLLNPGFVIGVQP
jgi:3'(2'), 5'-bisphosphate nucleotidase